MPSFRTASPLPIVNPAEIPFLSREWMEGHLSRPERTFRPNPASIAVDEYAQDSEEQLETLIATLQSFKIIGPSATAPGSTITIDNYSSASSDSGIHLSDCDSVSSPPLSPVSEELASDVESDASFRFPVASASPPPPRLRHLQDPRREFAAVSPHFFSSADSIGSSPSSPAAADGVVQISPHSPSFGRAAVFRGSFQGPAADSHHRHSYLGDFKPLPLTWRETNDDCGRRSLASSSSSSPLDFLHSRQFGSDCVEAPGGADPRQSRRHFAAVVEDAVHPLIPPPRVVDFTTRPPRPFSASLMSTVSVSSTTSKRFEQLPPRPATAFASSSYRDRPVGVPPPVRGSNAFEDMASQRRRCCQFCKNNGERESCYRSHPLKDDVTGLVTCPVLRKHVCDICGKTGDEAHTRRYCPENPDPTGPTVKVLQTSVRNSAGRRRRAPE